MAKNPAFLFYSSDFMTGTAFMTWAQKGKYISLLCLQHQHGHLTMEQIEAISKDSIVKNKFVLAGDGKYHNIRLHEEVMKRVKHSKLQSENAFKRWGKNNTESMPPHKNGIAMAMPLENESEDGNVFNEATGEVQEGNYFFEEFWRIYPKKTRKIDAEKLFKTFENQSEMLELIKNSLSWQITSPQWIREDGRFIPSPSTYLIERRWLDEKIISPTCPKCDGKGDYVSSKGYPCTCHLCKGTKINPEYNKK